MTLRIALLAALAAALGVGCEEDSPEPAVWRYPLEVGSMASWTGQSRISYYTPGVERRFVADSTFHFRLDLEVLEAGHLLGVPALRCIETLQWEGEEPLAGEVYYAADEDALWLLGLRGAGALVLGAGAPGLNCPAVERALAGRLRPGPAAGKVAAKSRATDEELVIFAVPRQVYAYPLEPGRSWVYQVEDEPFRIDRWVRGVQREDPGDGLGERSFIEIGWRFDEANDGHWDGEWNWTTILDEQGLYRYDHRREGLELFDETEQPLWSVDLREQAWRDED
jgi:hypothetical protein